MKTFLPEEWENVHSKDNSVSIDTVNESGRTNTPCYINGGEDAKDDVERVVRLIEQSNVDITIGYDAWVKVGFALASAFKQGGRGFFHRVSRLNAEYDTRKTDKQYDRCVNSKGHGITIATFFQMAKDAGIDITCSKFGSANANIPEKASSSSSTQESHIKENGSLDFWISGSGEKKCSENSLDVPTPVNSKDSNVSVQESQKSKNPKVHSTSDGSKWILNEDELPCFPQFIYDDLSPFLKEVIGNCISDDDRDMVLMGTLTCLSATMHNVSGKYHGDYWYPMLYFFVMADAGMGKGALNCCRQLVAPINKDLRECSERLIREFKEQNKIAKRDGNSLTEDEPQRHTLFIPTNSSASAFVEQLDNNDGIGLLFDTECDTLSSVLKTDYGDYSSYLRKGYHHEPIEMNRRKDSEFRCVEKPMIAVCLSGTPEQLHSLTPDTENGLFSRILYYHIPFKVEFCDTLMEDDSNTPHDSLREKFYQLGLKYQRMREAFFRGGDYHIVVPQFLCSEFNTHFRDLNQEAVDEISNAMQGVTRRLAFAVFRIMMILTAVRFMDEHPNASAFVRKNEPIKLFCSNEDFHIAMAIGDTLISHAAYCYAHLPKTGSVLGTSCKILSKADKMNMLYETLPDRFNKSEYVTKSRQLGYFPSTTSKWINAFILDGRLQRSGQNDYIKVSS